MVIPLVSARLEIAKINETQPISGNDLAATFRVPLQAGSTRVRAWFADEQGETCGAYYVYARRLG